MYIREERRRHLEARHCPELENFDSNQNFIRSVIDAYLNVAALVLAADLAVVGQSPL